MNKMYLVTGGCGFIGSHLVDLLIEKKHRVRVIDDLSNSTRKNLSPHAEFIHGSIMDDAVMRQAVEGVDGVFHLAALVSVPESIQNWYKTHLINCGGSVHLFELCKKIPIILASTAAVYGDSFHLPHQENTTPRPLSPYAVDKLASEMHAQIAWHLYRTPSIACRFFNVYGPRQNPSSPYSGVISKFVNQMTCKEPITIYDDGNQIRDFIYVKDIVNMLVQMMEKKFIGAQIYNLCTGKRHTINELANLIGKINGLPLKKIYAPARPGDIKFSVGDPSKTRQELNIEAQISLEEGLRKYIMDDD